MATDLQTGYTGLYMGRTLRQLQETVRDNLGESNFTRYSETKITDKLNHFQQQLAVMSRCLSGWALIPMRADIPSYALPKLCLPDGLERARFYDASDSYQDMELRPRDWMDEHYSNWKTATSGTPQIVVVGDWFGNVLKIELYPPPDTAGTTYTTGTDAGVVTGGTDLPSTWNNITGTATGGGTTTLQDSTVDFTTMGLVEGMAVVKTNATAGSEPIGYIDVIATTQLTFTAVLTNTGSFVAGDSYEIMAGEVGEITAIANEEEYLFTSEVGVVGQITVPANNLLVEYKRYPVELDNTKREYQKPEIPWAWHTAIADAAASELLIADTQRRSRQDTELAKYLMGKYTFAVGQATAKPDMPIRRPSSFVPRFKR